MGSDELIANLFRTSQIDKNFFDFTRLIILNMVEYDYK